MKSKSDQAKAERDKKRYAPPKKIGDILSDLMAQRGYAQIASRAELQKWWSDAVGTLEKFSRATEIKRGVLHVVVSNSVVMQELGFRKQEIIESLSTAKPDQSLKDIRYRVGTIR